MGQHRHLRMARLSHADQSRFPVPRFDFGSAHRARSGAVSRLGPADARTAPPWNPGMAQLLLQVSDDGAGALSRARSVYSTDEAEEHAAALEGRGVDYAPRTGILRLRLIFQRARERSHPLSRRFFWGLALAMGKSV